MNNIQFQDGVLTSQGKPIIAPDYQLARDKFRREIILLQRYIYAYLILYALNMAERLQDLEPKISREDFERKQSNKQFNKVNDEMHSLM